jgi:predicted RNA-binding Zn ribbon-like protein
VDTDAEFVIAGGRPCLDLVATLGKRHDTEPIERIPDPAALGRWLAAAGLLPAPPAVDIGHLDRARRLREAINTLVRVTPADPAAVATVNTEARRPDQPPQLTVNAAGRAGAAPTQGDASTALVGIARDAVHLLGSPSAARIKECEHSHCSLVFLDETQAGRRRWCSMNRCGNLVKIANYRRRRTA